MSFHQLITRWLAAQAMQAVKKEILHGPEEENAASENEPKQLSCDDVSSDAAAPELPVVDIGFVFAMPMEAAGIADVLKRSKTTKADGRVFRTGFLGKYRVALVESGVGQEKAGRAAEVLLDVFQPKRLISAGYGGGLTRRLKRFAVCFPEIVVRQEDGDTLDLTEVVPKRLDVPARDKLGLLTTDFVVASPKQKLELGKATGAEIVDMETFAVADVCRRREIPFLAARIILDTAEEQLPGDVQRILKNAEVGGARLVGSVLGSLFKRPSSILDLYSLKERALKATDRLAKQLVEELRIS